MARDLGVVEQRGAYHYYDTKSFQSGEFEELCKTTDLLKDSKFENPYFKTGKI